MEKEIKEINEPFFTRSKLFWTVVYDLMFLGIVVTTIAAYTGYQQFWIGKTAVIVGSIDAVDTVQNYLPSVRKK